MFGSMLNDPNGILDADWMHKNPFCWLLMWMHELYHILSETSDEKQAMKPRTPNTWVDRHILTTQCGDEDNQSMLEKIVVDLVSCGEHLDIVSTWSWIPHTQNMNFNQL